LPPPEKDAPHSCELSDKTKETCDVSKAVKKSTSAVAKKSVTRKTGTKTAAVKKATVAKKSAAVKKTTPTKRTAPKAGIQKKTQATVPTEAEIRRRAFDIYLEKGSFPGQDFDNWVQAERELRVS